MGLVRVNDLMMAIGYALVEPVVNTTMGTTIASGVQTVTPGSMVGIYAGASIVVGANGVGTQEIITITSVTASTFTATFANSHPSTDPLTGCTFPSGIPESTLFSTSEILSYLADSQNDFLLQVRPIYATAPLTIAAGVSIYQAPADAIRVERASIVNTATPSAYELWDTTQTDLDLESAGWPAGQGPSSWYQDQLTYQTIGFGPPPAVGNIVTLMYSQKATAPLTLLSTFLVPDPMTVAIKWRTLGLCFSKDGETKDPQKAMFAQQLYDLIVLASKKFMEGVDARMKSKEETVEPLASQRF